jgi:hypothetical protein
MAFLTAKALDIADGQAHDFDFVKRFFDGFQLGWLDNSLDHFHEWFLG